MTSNARYSPTFKGIVKKLCDYFGIDIKRARTRFNWYRDSSDWKPFHNDATAYLRWCAAKENVTVGVSFGAERELAFLNMKNGTRLYFPQTNGMLFHFGRDVNINWMHGVNALPKDEQSGKGRISIIVWGYVKDCIEEGGSPALLNDTRRKVLDTIRTEEEEGVQKNWDSDRAIFSLQEAIR